MKLFVTTITCSEFIGSYRLTHEQQKHWRNYINWKMIVVYSAYLLIFISITCEIIYDIDTFQDYTLSFFPWITSICVPFGFIINQIKTQPLFEVIDKIENIINSRKLIIFLKFYWNYQKKRKLLPKFGRFNSHFSKQN